MKVIAIGATGFIGRHVVSQLLDAGEEVAVLHRGKTALPSDWQVTELLGERSTLLDLRDKFRDWSPDVAIDMILSSALQARTTLQAFRGIARRVIAISSGDVYRAMAVLHRLDTGPVEPIPLTEDSTLRHGTKPYTPEALAGARAALPWIDDDYDKVEVEQAISSDPELPATILRLPMVHGPGDMFHRFYPVLKRMIDKRPAILQEHAFARWITCRGYVENVAQAVVLATTSEASAGRTYNVADQDNSSEFQWTLKIAQEFGWWGRVISVPHEQTPKHLLTQHNFEQNLFMDSTRIRTELGYTERVSLHEGIRRTIEWERANAPQQIDPAQFDYAAEDEAILSSAIHIAAQ
jgi:nucleoside-diphosphate-sugar epimerase